VRATTRCIAVAATTAALFCVRSIGATERTTNDESPRVGRMATSSAQLDQPVRTAVKDAAPDGAPHKLLGPRSQAPDEGSGGACASEREQIQRLKALIGSLEEKIRLLEEKVMDLTRFRGQSRYAATPVAARCCFS
jgi:hypothetical protein